MTNGLLNFIKILLALTLLNRAAYANTYDPRVPDTNFRCQDHQFPGYFADPETDCQVFHICVHRITSYDQYSFLCPNQTAFDQKLLVCQWQDRVDCADSTSHYEKNRRIFQDQEHDSNEIHSDFDDSIRGSRRQGKALPVDFIHDVQDIPVEGAIPEESRQPLGILSSSGKKSNLKTGRQNADGPNAGFRKPLDASLKKQQPFKQQSTGQKLKEDKIINLKHSKLSDKKVTNKLPTAGNVRSSKVNLNTKKLISNKTHKKITSLSGFTPSRKFPNSQITSSKLSPKLSITNKSTTTSKINAAINKSNKNIGKPLKKATTSIRGKKKLSQTKLLRTQNIGTIGNSKLSTKKASNFPRKEIKGTPEFKLNIPSSRPLSAGIPLSSLTPITKRTKQANANKTPILIISSAEADTNEDNQKRVYVNRIKTSDSNTGVEVFGGKPLTVARTQKKNREKPQKKIASLQGSRGVPTSTKTSKKNSPRLKISQSPKVSKSPSISDRFKQTNRNQQPRADIQRTTFRDESLEEGKLGLIASSILKLQPRFF